MWARGGLGVELHAGDRQRLVPQALDGAVIQVAVRHLERQPGERIVTA